MVAIPLQSAVGAHGSQRRLLCVRRDSWATRWDPLGVVVWQFRGNPLAQAHGTTRRRHVRAWVSLARQVCPREPEPVAKDP